MKDILQRRENLRSLHNLDSEATVEDLMRETPIIYATLEDQQAYHQSNVIKVKGRIAKKPISILIDLGSTHSYAMSRTIQCCRFIKKKHDKSWLVQLEIGTKTKVCEVVMECPLELTGIFTKSNLNILPMGSYVVLIEMDWLE